MTDEQRADYNARVRRQRRRRPCRQCGQELEFLPTQFGTQVACAPLSVGDDDVLFDPSVHHVHRCIGHKSRSARR